MSFPQILKELRTEKGLTRTVVAKECNVSTQCISALEMGKRNPAGSTLSALADFFQCSTDYLLGREDDFGNIVIQTNGSPQLTDPERTLLTAFKRLPPDLQVRAIAYVQGLDDAINGPARKYSHGK